MGTVVLVGLQIDKGLNLSLVKREQRGLCRDDVVIRVLASGICSTDIHIVNGESRVSPPVVLGHEFGGVVETVGEEVRDLKSGDTVAVDPNISCGKCEYCREGKPHLCSNLKAIGVDVDGGMSDRCVVPAKQVYKMPQGFNIGDLPFIEPLSCVLHGLDIVSVRHGERVLIIGTGTIGLMHLKLLKNIAGEICVDDINPSRRELAASLGGARVGGEPDSHFDAVLECSGTVAGFERAVRLVKRGGRVLVFGVAPRTAQAGISPNAIYSKEITIMGSYINPNTFGRAVALVSSGKIGFGDLDIKFFRLEEFEKAFEASASGQHSKVAFTPTEAI